MGQVPLQPVIDFNKYIANRTQHFTGRTWVFKHIDAWIAGATKTRFFLLVAEPGSGKTALAARLCQFSDGAAVPPDDLSHLSSHCISAYHFCSARYSLWIDPLTFTRSLALQLSRYPDYAQALLQVAEHDVNIHVQQLIHNVAPEGVVQGIVIQHLTIANLNAQESFNRIILEPLENIYRQGLSTPMTIAIDGLDEALAHAGKPTIVDLLSRLHELPQQVRFLLTSRPDGHVENKFRNAEIVLLSSPEYDQHNQEDIHQYVQVRLRNDRELAKRAAQVDSKHIAELVEIVPRKAEGNFLYVQFLLDAMAKGVRSLTELEGLPEGLDGLYFDSLERVVTLGKQDWYHDFAPLIGVLMVAQDSLTQTQLEALTGLTESDIWHDLGVLQQFLEKGEEKGKPEETRYRVYHQSLIDFLNRKWIIVKKEDAETEDVEDGEDEVEEDTKEVLRNTFYLSAEEWHIKVAHRCEQDDIMRAWEDKRHDLVEQCRREYARKYYVTHLYVSQAWQRLFEILDAVPYGKAKLRNDPSTRSYALDLDLGRQATMWDGWTVDEGMTLLPRLWRYTLLRCSLASRVEQYPEEAFRLLVILGRKQEALELAELLTDPVRKVHVLQHIAEQLREQASQDTEWLEILMRAGDVARTIPFSDTQDRALSTLSMALAQAQQWEQALEVWAEAERVHGPIPPISFSDEQARALSMLGTALAQAQQWAEAERVIGSIPDSDKQPRVLSMLGTALAQAGQWAEAERVIGKMRNSDERAKSLMELGTAMVNADEFEEVLHMIQRSWRQVEMRDETLTLFSLASSIISRKPEIGIDFFDAFTWVNTFLSG